MSRDDVANGDIIAPSTEHSAGVSPPGVWVTEQGSNAMAETNDDQGANPTWFLPKSEITTLALGTILQQRYRVEAVVGIGGMGAVYRVRDMRFPGATKYLALKEMITRFKDHMDQRTKLSQFDREANILASLDHPAIPKVHDLFTEYDRAYLVLDYVEGRNLETYLHETPGMLGERLVGTWGLELCDVLQYLHTYKVGAVMTPIVFRDLKPSNIMLTNQSRIVVVDFGIAKIFQDGKPGTTIGTQGYSPPEQYLGISDTRSDIYSLGATLHHLLTRSDPQDGAIPFAFDQRMPRALNPMVSEAMEQVIMRCLEYEREDRYQTALEVRDALRQALRIDPQPSHMLPSPSQPVPIGSLNLAVRESGGLSGTGLVWKYRTEDEVRSSPAVTKDSVFIGSYDKHLYALTRDGDLRWRFEAEAGICVTPCAWKGLVIVGSEDFNIYGIRADSGQEAWTYRTWGSVLASPRVYGEGVFCGSDDGYLHALDPRSGRPLWKFRAWQPVRSSVAHLDGVLYFGSDDDRLYAVDALTGEEKWRYPTVGDVTSSPAVANDMVYFGSLDFCVYALDAKMGWKAWDQRTSNFVVSSPSVANDRVYIGSVDHHLYCFDARTGRKLWAFQAGGQVTSSPVVADGVVYFGCVDGAVYAVDAIEGHMRWRYQTGGPVPSSPAVADGIVYIGSMDKHIYALEA
jgi:eukaryotic-like serine/threonine-protein kinase